MLNGRRLIFLVSLALFTASSRAAPLQPVPQPQATRLQPSSEPVTRQISGTETHEYRVTLKAQQALHVIANEVGVNLTMNVSGPDGEPIVEMVSPAGPNASDSLWVIASKTGDYTLAVRNARGSGRYELRVDALRDATADDRKHLELQDALLAAFRSDDLRAARDSFRQVLTAARALKDDAVATRAGTVLLQLDPRMVLETSGLNSIPGAPYAYSSSGYEHRARSMRDRLKPAIDFLDSNLQVAVTVHLAVLARDDWSRLIARFPYGTPFQALAPRDPTTSSPRDAVVFMPVTDPGSGGWEQMWAEMRRPGALAPGVAATLKATGVSFDDGAQLSSDERMYHELGHVYAQAYGIGLRGDGGKWLNEFLANYLSVAYATEVPRPRDPGRIFFAALTNYHLATYRPQGGTLEAIGGNGLRYSWFQFQFVKRAEEVYKTQGLAFLQRVRDTLPPTNESISVQESLARLEKISPGFVKWAADLAAQGSSGGVR